MGIRNVDDSKSWSWIGIVVDLTVEVCNVIVILNRFWFSSEYSGRVLIDSYRFKAGNSTDFQKLVADSFL
jgi:hypothetical protein